MRFIHIWLSGTIAFAVIASTGCETAEQKPAKSAPPSAAMAPAIQQPSAVTPAPAPQQQTQQRQQAASPQVDPVPALIQKVEQEYQAGQTNYATGHLEAAKANFDRAVDMLMQGPVDVGSDERLQREFD